VGEYQQDDEEVEFEVTYQLSQELDRLYTSGGKTQMGCAWAGIMCFTPDKHPIVGPIAELENQYLSVGYSGHGMVRAFSCGRHIAEQITKSNLTCPEID
jgi:glycine/D-amino acid oxidase-like deaminating enzyme